MTIVMDTVSKPRSMLIEETKRARYSAVVTRFELSEGAAESSPFAVAPRFANREQYSFFWAEDIKLESMTSFVKSSAISDGE